MFLVKKKKKKTQMDIYKVFYSSPNLLVIDGSKSESKPQEVQREMNRADVVEWLSSLRQ